MIVIVLGNFRTYQPGIVDPNGPMDLKSFRFVFAVQSILQIMIERQRRNLLTVTLR